MRRLPATAWILVAANAVPLAGVLLFGWDLAEILLLYWVESAVVGGFTILKMLSKRAWSALFYAPFFAAHYGVFMIVHLVFLVTLFLQGPFAGEERALGATLRNVGIGALALVASHGASFWANFLRGGERERLDMSAIMMRPYPRIVVMQLTILFGAFLAFALGSPVFALVLLLALKTGVDVKAHLAERDPAAPSPWPWLRRGR